MTQTIAQMLNVKEFPFYIKDKNGNVIYYENSDGYWLKKAYDSTGKLLSVEDSEGYWEKREYDRFGDRVYFENSKGEIYDDRTNK